MQQKSRILDTHILHHYTPHWCSEPIYRWGVRHFEKLLLVEGVGPERIQDFPPIRVSLACIACLFFQRTRSTGFHPGSGQQTLPSSCGRRNCDVNKRRDESVANHDPNDEGCITSNSLPPKSFHH